MRITSVKEKRPVPIGAKDLELYDDVTYLKCGKCGATSKEGLETCHCGSITLKYDRASQLPEKIDQPASLKVNTINDDDGQSVYYECLNCIKCYICGKPLSTNLNRISQKTLPRDTSLRR